MIRSKWASVAFAAASFVATTAGIAGLSNSASAEDVRVTEHTYSGGVKSSLSGGGAKEYHLNLRVSCWARLCGRCRGQPYAAAHLRQAGD